MKRILLWLVYPVFLGAAVLILTEAALWIFFPLNTKEEIKAELKQNLDGLTPEIVYETNSFGFRTLSMKTRQKPPNVIRIMAIGASTTNQISQSTDKLWSGILEQKLNEKYAEEPFGIEVAAWGNGGEKVFDRARFARNEIPRYDPDIVITLEGINDLAWHGGPEYAYDGPRSRLRPAKEKWYTFIKRLQHKYSQIYRRVRRVQDRREEKQKIDEGRILRYHTDTRQRNHEWYMALPYRESIVRDPDPAVEFKDGMWELLMNLSMQGRRVLVLSQPTLWRKEMPRECRDTLWFSVNTAEGPLRPDSGWLEEEMRRYNQIQRELAVKCGAVYVSLDKMIPKIRDYFYDDCHFTDLGNRAVASCVLPALIPLVEAAAAERELRPDKDRAYP